MKIHKEGFNTIGIVFTFLAILNGVVHFYVPYIVVEVLVGIVSLAFFYVIVQFFRVPKRIRFTDPNLVISPADGEVVVIEEVEEPEYFKDKRLQVSIFMSPFNVHINWFPVGGVVSYFKYHAGKYLVAYHPKSSTENERTTLVVKRNDGVEVLFRQIAGAVARRVVAYPKVNDIAVQAMPFGFIKFGSRVDIFLPLGTKVNVQLKQKVTGSITTIAELPVK